MINIHVQFSLYHWYSILVLFSFCSECTTLKFNASLLTEASLIAQLVKNPSAMQETVVQFLVGKIPWSRDSLPTPVFLGFPCGSARKESACNAGGSGFVPWVGNIPWRRERLLQYSGLENSMDCIVHGIAKSCLWLSDFHFLLFDEA